MQHTCKRRSATAMEPKTEETWGQRGPRSRIIRHRPGHTTEGSMVHLMTGRECGQVWRGTLSVSLSMEAVASSSTRMRGRRRIARAMQISWRCPTEKLSPPSATGCPRQHKTTKRRRQQHHMPTRHTHRSWPFSAVKERRRKSIGKKPLW